VIRSRILIRGIHNIPVKISRATFLSALGCAGFGTCLDLAAPWTAWAADGGVWAALSGEPISLRDVTPARFRVHLGDRFAVRTSANARHVLTLVEVSERPVAHGIEQFSLIFHAPPPAALASGTYVVSHPRLGAFDLSLSPIGPANRPRVVYQACFNRHATAGHRRT
jgi:uncharacterized protein DUF6916